MGMTKITLYEFRCDECGKSFTTDLEISKVAKRWISVYISGKINGENWQMNDLFYCSSDCLIAAFAKNINNMGPSG